MLNPFVDLLASAITLYLYCIIAWAIMSMLLAFKVMNAYQPVVQKVMYALNRLCEPSMRPIRKALPDMGGVDISPVIVILLLNFAKSALYTYLYNL